MRREIKRILPEILAVFFVIMLFVASPPEAARSENLEDALPSFARLVTHIAPAVVNISSETTIKPGPADQEDETASPEERFREFFEKFFGNQPEKPMKRRALGSGFIIDPSGLIITNNHVVQKSSAITVVLVDQKELKAKVIGTDPKTDLALIKITTKDPLPALSFGNSDAMEVGDWVIAIGNPFGLASTVTHGIISAKGRVIGIGPYDDFLQTDAPVNPGNSGGPLLNLKGEVIGVTTAMASGQSIGFAIPSNLAKTITDQLREKGKVTRGYIGASVQDITPQLAQALGLKDTKGALVGDVVPGAPAEAAGIKRGDVIIAFGEKAVRTANDLPIIVAETGVGKTVSVKLIRDGKEMTLQVQVQELKEQKGLVTKTAGGAEFKEELGMTIGDITAAKQQELGLKDRNGIAVIDVKDGGPASDAGIQEGDVILSVNRKAVKNVNEFKATVEASRKEQPLLFLIRRGSTTLFVTVERP